MAALPQSQEGTDPVPRHRVREQDAALHETHSLKWQYNKKSFTITCNNARGVESVLKESFEFKNIAEKNNKELVIIRSGRAISSHFPCSLVKNERLTLMYIKAAAAPAPMQPHSGSDHRQKKKKRPSSERVMFHLSTKEGACVKKIMRNPELEKCNVLTITVYAYKGEKVKYALKRDGRLLDIVFEKNCALSNIDTNETTEMSDLVHDHDGQTFMIKLLDKGGPPGSQPDSLEETCTGKIEPTTCDSEEIGPLPPSATTESVNVNTPKNEAQPDGKKAPDMLTEILHSEQIQISLSAEFKKMLKGMNNQKVPSFSQVRNLLHVKYSKNDETCREVRTMKTLMDLSNSVCQVRNDGRAEGSGFLLFDNFVLTNGHVAERFYNENTQHLSPVATVHFSFESFDQMGAGAAVEEVVGFENVCDESGQKQDWALMRIGTDQELPHGLLTRWAVRPKCSGISMIGHPNGNVKMIDPCHIILGYT
ncbi:LOW QUALITY PROTEIN: serine protease FAM111A-like [Spinachia spinachia]